MKNELRKELGFEGSCDAALVDSIFDGDLLEVVLFVVCFGKAFDFITNGPFESRSLGSLSSLSRICCCPADPAVLSFGFSFSAVNAVACVKICEAFSDECSIWSSLPEVLAARFDVGLFDIVFGVSFFFTSRLFLVVGGSRLPSSGPAFSTALLTAFRALVFFADASTGEMLSASTTASSPGAFFDLVRFLIVVSADILNI